MIKSTAESTTKIGGTIYFLEKPIIYSYLFSSTPGTLDGKESTKFILKVFHTQRTHHKPLDFVSRVVLGCHSKLNEYFAVPVPVKLKTKQEKKDEGNIENASFIGFYDLPLPENALFKGCSKDELINKGLIHVTSIGQVTCRHLTRLVRFIEGIVPKNIKNDDTIISWAKNAARIRSVLEVLTFIYMSKINGTFCLLKKSKHLLLIFSFL